MCSPKSSKYALGLPFICPLIRVQVLVEEFHVYRPILSAIMAEYRTHIDNLKRQIGNLFVRTAPCMPYSLCLRIDSLA